MTVFLHVFFIVFFIAVPYLTFNVRGPNRNPSTEPLTRDLNSIWVTSVYLRFCFQNAILVLLFYLNYLVIAPHFLAKKKNNLLFILTGFTAILFFIYLIFLFHRGIDMHIGRNPMPFKLRFIDSFLYCLAIFALSTVLFLSGSYKKLQQQQLESELLFLRSQINPHFLFNSLNNIYSLIVLKSEKAADAMLKLSDLLRFALYESGEKFILLSKELKYIDDYISLQSMRLNENVKIHYETTEHSADKKIHPMLLVPFIENAFKHGVSYSEPSEISISISIENGRLELFVKNTIFRNKSGQLNELSGIGMNNVTRRLEIIYAGKFKLEKFERKDSYEVVLKINLNES